MCWLQSAEKNKPSKLKKKKQQFLSSENMKQIQTYTDLSNPKLYYNSKYHRQMTDDRLIQQKY